MLIAALSGLTGAVISVAQSIRFVHEGEQGLKLRFGKVVRSQGTGNPRIINPGWVWMIPFVDKLYRHHVRQQTLRMSDQCIVLKDGMSFTVGAVVFFRIIDIYAALFQIDNFERSLDDLCCSALRDEFTQRTHTQISNTIEISEKLLADVRETAELWGIRIAQFRIINCEPLPAAAQLINLEGAVQLKLQALEKAAEKLGCRLTEIPPQLAAVFLGIPMTAVAAAEVGTGGSRRVPLGTPDERKEDESDT